MKVQNGRRFFLSRLSYTILGTAILPKWLAAFPAQNEFTICIKARIEKGGLIHAPQFAVVALENGLLVAILPVTDEKGSMYTEIPLSVIPQGQLQNMFFRFRNNKLEFICNGRLLNALKIPGNVLPIDDNKTLIGDWDLQSAPGDAFPEDIRSFLFQRTFSGEMDDVCIWKKYLPDEEIAKLSGINSINYSLPEPRYENALSAYREFHNASRSGNVALCTQLGSEMRRFMSSDPNRPVFHLTAPLDGIMDPAGAFFHKGKYHVYSYRNMVSMLACTPLAHYVSDDLIHWKDMPIGVWADSDLDVYGIWLGNIFYDDDGIPNMLYTALGKKGKIGVLARSHNDLLTFTDKQAVITDRVHHDGHTWKDAGKWYSLTTEQYWGRREGDTGDAIVLLSSDNLINWKEEGEIFSAKKDRHPVSQQQKTGFTEYPYLIPFGEKYALIIGTRPVRYWIGKFDRSIPKFIPDNETPKYLDHLNPFHCFNPSAIDNKGEGNSARRIIMGMNLYASGQVEGLRWYGVHVLPRVLTIEGDHLCQEPVKETEKLRSENKQFRNIRLRAGAGKLFKDIPADTLELIATFDPGTAKDFGIKIRGVSIIYHTAPSIFTVSGNLKVPGKSYPEMGSGPSYCKKGDKITIRIFIDKCLLEVFINGQTACGIINTGENNQGIELFSEGGDCKLLSLDTWKCVLSGNVL